MAGPRASLTVARGAIAGEGLTIVGTNFGDDETLLFRWDGVHVGWLGSVETSGDGAFEAIATVPANVHTGEHTLVAEEVRPAPQGEPTVVRRATLEVTISQKVGFDAGLRNPESSSGPTTNPTATPSPTLRPTAAPSSATTAAPSSATTAPSAPTTAPAPPTVPPAVGVAGYGAGSKGGSGGRVLTVSNLNDSGAGSLRAAIEASGPRIVVFAVGGTINLGKDLRVSEPFLTVDASSAPKPVILRDGMLLVATHEVILRHLRLRPGDVVGNPSEVDAVGINGLSGEVYNVVLDHLSMIWGPDIGGLSILGNVHDVTIQYSIMGEGLRLSRHPEGVTAQGGHSMAASVFQLDAGVQWGQRLTFHHNLFTTSDQRMPVVQGAECVDLVNNVIYNWGNKGLHGNPRAMNVVNNWFRSGPETTKKLIYEWQHHSANPKPYANSVYLAGNTADGFAHAVDAPTGVVRTAAACGGLSVDAETAQAAYNNVLGSAGATLPVRDAVDQRIINNVLNRMGTFFNGAGQAAPTPYDP